jgi:hypothetical protein
MPSMTPSNVAPTERRLAAVWFADIVGYSRLGSVTLAVTT